MVVTLFGVGLPVAPQHDVSVVEMAEVQDAKATEAVVRGGGRVDAPQPPRLGARGAPPDDLGPDVGANVVAPPLGALRMRVVDVAAAAEPPSVALRVVRRGAGRRTIGAVGVVGRASVPLVAWLPLPLPLAVALAVSVALRLWTAPWPWPPQLFEPGSSAATTVRLGAAGPPRTVARHLRCATVVPRLMVYQCARRPRLGRRCSFRSILSSYKNPYCDVALRLPLTPSYRFSTRR